MAKKRPISSSRAGSGSLRLTLVLAVLVAVNLYVFLWRGGTSIPAVMEKAAVAGDPILQPREPELAEVPEASAPVEASVPEKEISGDRSGTVQTGDSLGKILRREGLSAESADELIRALGEHLDFRTIQVGQAYRVDVDEDGSVREFEFEVSRVEKVKAVRGEAGTLEATKIRAPTEVRNEATGGTIENSLFVAMTRAGEDASLVSFFVDVFAYDLNFYVDTHVGDEYRLVVEKEFLDGEFLGYGRVLAAEYRGRTGTFRAFWWQPGTESGKYYDQEGRSVERTLLKTPLKFARVSSRFNPRRMHPVLHVRRGHWGVDYAAPVGTPIWAAASGKIAFRGRRGGSGNCVIVNHVSDMQTVYMHLSRFRPGQRVGSQVRAKDVIGYVGATGLATGPHLHFGVKRNGRYIDPLKMKMSREQGVRVAQRAAFERDIAPWIDRLAAIQLAPRRRNPFVVQLTPA